jgi:ribulose bisphosphate carboxylase small subunit
VEYWRVKNRILAALKHFFGQKQSQKVELWRVKSIILAALKYSYGQNSHRKWNFDGWKTEFRQSRSTFTVKTVTESGILTGEKPNFGRVEALFRSKQSQKMEFWRVKNRISAELRHFFVQNSHRKWNSDGWKTEFWQRWGTFSFKTVTESGILTGEKPNFGRVEALLRWKQSRKVEFWRVENRILAELRHFYGQNSHRKWNSDGWKTEFWQSWGTFTVKTVTESGIVMGEKQNFGRVEALLRSKQSQKVEFWRVENRILAELRHFYGQNSHRKWNTDGWKTEFWQSWGTFTVKTVTESGILTGEKHNFGRVEARFRSKQSQKVECWRWKT